MKTRIFAITFLVAVVLCGCSKNEHDESTADFDPRMELERPGLVASPDTSAHPESRIAEIGPRVHGGVLTEFARRGGGECVLTRAESSVDGIFHFEWESPQDRSWASGEVLAAVMSVLRGYDGYVGGFEIVRTDDEGKQRITITGTDYNAWLDGKINDPAFLEKCGLSD